MHGGFEVDSILHSKALGNFGKNYDDTAMLVLQICRPTNWKLLPGVGWCSKKEIENEGPFILERSPIFCCSVDLRVVLGTSVNFSSSSEPSEKIFEPSRARAISQEMIFEPSRARAEKASSAFEREQNRASINHFSSMIFHSISSKVERKPSANRAPTFFKYV